MSTPKNTHKNKNKNIIMTVLVAALGYFVDIYDLILFSVVRTSSLRSLGVPQAELMNEGLFLLNMQMTGMLIGGVLWGVLGDKRGRVSVLFGSIFLYSAANIANAYVDTVFWYGIWRFIAGIGLAGELGAAITLVSEIMSKESRGYGTTIVASVGICGAIVAAQIGNRFSWTTAYIVGGVLGFLLLGLRIGIYDSGMYQSLQGSKTKRGNFLMLFSSWSRFKKYLNCILIGVPIWFVIGVLVSFSPELSLAMGIEGVSAGYAVMYCYIGLALGDLASGLLSQLFKNRKKVIFVFISMTLAFVFYYIFMGTVTLSHFYWVCGLLGFAIGYWAIFVTVASEQFGTNIRATVTTTVPNFVRGSVVLITSAFKSLASTYGFSVLNSALVIGLVCVAIAYIALLNLKETFAKDLDYTEVE
ncbi:MAG: MFS transporter [Pseudomonadota bacterium]|nr:MFS transporter [Pseudomonadota bacterium]